MGLSLATAEQWVERWELQQQRYAVDREERFTVIADVVEHVTAGRAGRPLVVDLGCGPGSLAARLVRRLPDAEIVAVDRDPVLLELGRTHHPDAARYVDAEIGGPGWTGTLGLDRPLDAAVSTTALHYLDRDTLLRTYRQLASLLRPGASSSTATISPRTPPARPGSSPMSGDAEPTGSGPSPTRTGAPGGPPSPMTPSWPTSSRSAAAGRSLSTPAAPRSYPLGPSGAVAAGGVRHSGAGLAVRRQLRGRRGALGPAWPLRAPSDGGRRRVLGQCTQKSPYSPAAEPQPRRRARGRSAHT